MAGWLAFALMAVVMFPVGSLAQDSCQASGPVLVNVDGKPKWLTTEELLKRETHCVAPQMPPLARQARIEGQVLVDILVDEGGKVSCARLVSGHPLLAASAIDAARQWTFRPMKQSGRKVSFYGHLVFHVSTEAAKNESPCTVARW